MSKAPLASAGWKYPLVLVAAIVLVYVQSLTFDFVNYDDPDLVSQNAEFLSNPANVATAFTTHAFTSHREESAYYRPLLLVSLIADYQIWQLNPLGYHLTNLLLHALAAYLLYRLFLLLGLEELAAALAALLFALHPIQTESVAWVAGRNDALVGLFVILMMYAYAMRDAQPERAERWGFISAGAFVLALLTKESAAFFLILPAMYELVVRRRSPRALFDGGRGLIFGLFGAGLAGYLAVRYALFGEIIGAERLYGVIPPETRLTMIPGMLAEHLALMIAPYRLAVVHPLQDVVWFTAPWTVVSYVVVALVAIALWWTWKRDRIACFGLAWLVVGLIPVLNIFPLAVPVLEHRLYTAAAGLSLAAVVLVRRWLGAPNARTVLAVGDGIALQRLFDPGFVQLVQLDTAKVKAAFVRDPLVKALEVEVDTYKGTVQLSGFVNSPAEKAKAEAAKPISFAPVPSPAAMSVSSGDSISAWMPTAAIEAAPVSGAPQPLERRGELSAMTSTRPRGRCRLVASAVFRLFQASRRLLA